VNRLKTQEQWVPDIQRSVAEYNAWYQARAPVIYADLRVAIQSDADAALRATDQLRNVTAAVLRLNPRIITALRLAAAPPMARDRLVEMVGVPRAFVTALEEGRVSTRTTSSDYLEALAGFLSPVFDPVIFPWVLSGRSPLPAERAVALVVLGDRIVRSVADPAIRNEQEARQKGLMRGFLAGRGYTEHPTATHLTLGPMCFRMGCNVPVQSATGQLINMPIDCVARPGSDSHLVCIEMKSAGDFANPNKRRKEEAAKMEQLTRSYGSGVTFLLQLSGFFNRSYLSYEADHDIDWAWDHRLGDLNRYL
jgi:hypothetical protein